MLFFIVKEKNWFWPTTQYVIFPVLDVCWSIHNLLLVPSTITWWIYYFTAPETSATPLIQGLDDIPKHETSSCSQGPYIVDEEKGIKDPYIVCVLWMRKEHRFIFAVVVLDLGVKSWGRVSRELSFMFGIIQCSSCPHYTKQIYQSLRKNPPSIVSSWVLRKNSLISHEQIIQKYGHRCNGLR